MRPDDYTFSDPKLLYGPDAVEVFWRGVNYLMINAPSPRAGRVDVIFECPAHTQVLPNCRDPFRACQAAADVIALQHLVGELRDNLPLGREERLVLQITGYDFDDPSKPLFPHQYRAGWAIGRRYTRFTLHTLRGHTALTVTQNFAATNRMHQRAAQRKPPMEDEIICADLPRPERQRVLAKFIHQLAVTPNSPSLPPALMAIRLSRPKPARR